MTTLPPHLKKLANLWDRGYTISASTGKVKKLTRTQKRSVGKLVGAKYYTYKGKKIKIRK